jgi:hypothetical protein
MYIVSMEHVEGFDPVRSDLLLETDDAPSREGRDSENIPRDSANSLRIDLMMW